MPTKKGIFFALDKFCCFNTIKTGMFVSGNSGMINKIK